jgi:hypothetical protein
MAWEKHHGRSERLAMEAQIAVQQGEPDTACRIYVLAAEAESRALAALDPEKRRTLGITVVSAASLWLKAGDLARSWQLSTDWLSKDVLPPFAREQLEELLGVISGGGDIVDPKTPLASPVSAEEIRMLNDEIEILYHKIHERERGEIWISWVREDFGLGLLRSRLRNLQEEEARAACFRKIASSEMAVSMTERILERARQVLDS